MCPEYPLGSCARQSYSRVFLELNRAKGFGPAATLPVSSFNPSPPFEGDEAVLDQRILRRASFHFRNCAAFFPPPDLSHATSYIAAGKLAQNSWPSWVHPSFRAACPYISLIAPSLCHCPGSRGREKSGATFHFIFPAQKEAALQCNDHSPHVLCCAWPSCCDHCHLLMAFSFARLSRLRARRQLIKASELTAKDWFIPVVLVTILYFLWVRTVYL